MFNIFNLIFFDTVTNASYSPDPINQFLYEIFSEQTLVILYHLEYKCRTAHVYGVAIDGCAQSISLYINQLLDELFPGCDDLYHQELVRNMVNVYGDPIIAYLLEAGSNYPQMAEAGYTSAGPSNFYDLLLDSLLVTKAEYPSGGPYPFQVDGVIYENRAEFEVAKAYFYFEASQYIWASPKYIDSVWQARINPNAPQEAWHHYQSLTPELSQVYFEIWKEYVTNKTMLSFNDYLEELMIKRLDDLQARSGEKVSNTIWGWLFPSPTISDFVQSWGDSLRISYGEVLQKEFGFEIKEGPIFLDDSPRYLPVGLGSELDTCQLVDGIIFPCNNEEFFICNTPQLANFGFPSIFQVEMKLFRWFKASCPFFYAFFEYSIQNDPRLGQLGYYFIIIMCIFLFWFILYKGFRLFKLIKEEYEEEYYTRKLFNGLAEIRTFKELRRAYRYGWLSNVVNDLIMVDFDIVKYIPKLIYNRRDMEVGKKKFLQFWKEVYRQYKKWKYPLRSIPLGVKLPYIMSYGVYKIPTLKLLYNQLQGLVIVLYIRRIVYIFFISFFLFGINWILRWVFIYLHIYRITKYFLFVILYHYISFKLSVKRAYAYFVIRICLKGYNWVAYVLFLDGHVLAYPFFNFWPTYINSFEMDTYKDAPRMYPVSLKKFIKAIMPINYSNLHTQEFYISWWGSFFVLIINWLIILPFTWVVGKTVRLFLGLGVRSFSLYFFIIRFYRIVLARTLLGDLISFSNRLKNFLIYILLLWLIIFSKYVLLFILIVSALMFLIFFITLRLRTHFFIYLQNLLTFFFILVGGVVVYSGELIRYFVIIFIYVFLTIFFRFKYILFIVLTIYFGVTTNFFYFLICRGLFDFEEFMLDFAEVLVGQSFPLRTGWVPPFDLQEPISTIIYHPSRGVRKLASILTPPEYLGMQPIWNRKLAAFAHWFPTLFPTGLQQGFRANWPGPMLLRQHVIGSDGYCMKIRYSELLLYSVNVNHLDVSRWLGDHKIYWIRSQLFSHNISLDGVLNCEGKCLRNVLHIGLTGSGERLLLIHLPIYCSGLRILYSILACLFFR